MNQTNGRDLESLKSFVAAVCTVPLTDASSDDICLLLFMLQTMSRVLTTVTDEPFYKMERDAGLNPYNLFAPVAEELLHRAGTTGDDAFWLSPDMDAKYWPLHIRLMLRAGPDLEGKQNVSEFLALGVRFNTLGPVAHFFLTQLTAATAASPTMQRNNVVKALLLKLYSFLRKPLDRDPTSDLDPDDVYPRDFHLHEFAGSVSGLENAAKEAFAAVINRIRAADGEDVANIVEIAATKAGAQNQMQFLHENMEGVETAAVEDGAGDKGVLWLAQMPSLILLSDVLYHLGAQVDEEKAFEVVVEENLASEFDDEDEAAEGMDVDEAEDEDDEDDDEEDDFRQVKFRRVPGLVSGQTAPRRK